MVLKTLLIKILPRLLLGLFNDNKAPISSEITVNKIYEWSITKESNKIVTIKHKQSETLDPASSGISSQRAPFESTFADIPVWPQYNTLYFNDGVEDWVCDKRKQEIGFVFEVSLVGNILKGTFRESTSAAEETTLTEFNLVKK